MKKGVSGKKNLFLIIILFLILILACVFLFFKFNGMTGKVVSSNVLSNNFKVMTWNLHGEVFIAGIPTAGDWKDIPRSVSEIINVVASENPDLVVFDAVYRNFENQLKQAMIQKGYSYNYIQTAMPTSNTNFKKAIFSKYSFVSTDHYIPNIQEYFTNDETYAAKNAILKVKINLAGNSYSFFAGAIAPGRRQLKLNHDYFQNNIYTPLINANEPHFILGDFNLGLDSHDMNWYNTVYIAPENFPSAKFYNDNYNDVCQSYKDNTCTDSVPPVNGDGRIDQIIFRDYLGRKTIYLKKAYIRQDTDNSYDISDHFPVVAEFLITNSQVLSGDINGDKKSETALVDNNAYSWAINSADGVNLANTQWGFKDATPLIGDFDGDGKSDIAVWNPDGGKWFVYSLAKGNLIWDKPWGSKSMIPVLGDYDGDGVSDLALWDFIEGKWYVYSVPTSQVIVYGKQLGSNGMIPVSGDYDGDKKSDLALWDPDFGKWYIRDALDTKNIVYGLAWGTKGMIPVSGDYDGDGKADLALWNPTDGKWYIRDATGDRVIVWAKQFGSNGMIPVSGDYNGDGKSDLAYYDLVIKKLFFEPSMTNQISPCTELNWNFVLSPSTCPSTSQQTKTWTKVGTCSGGVSHFASETVSCNYIPTILTCTSFTYSDWSACSQGGIQTRTIITQSPSGCTGGNPVISQSCNYVPACTQSDWSFILSPSPCPASGQQTKTWTKTKECSLGVIHSPTEIVSCNYVPAVVTCNDFTYSSWSECSTLGKQTRTIVSQLPSGCSGGNPNLVQDCNYIPACTESDWSSTLLPATCPASSEQTKTWIKTKECTNGVIHPASESVSCIYSPSAPTCNSFTYSSWGECSTLGKQTRIVTSSLPEGCVDGSPNLVMDCEYVAVCTANNWVYNDSECYSNNTLLRTWEKIGVCTNGIHKDTSENLACDYSLPICTYFEYSSWSDCLTSGISTRNVLSSIPSGCSLGNPQLTQTCNYLVNRTTEKYPIIDLANVSNGEEPTTEEKNVSKYTLKNYVEDIGFFTKLWCKIIHPWDLDNYNRCIYGA